jgi:hypothetical protein
MDLLYTDRWVNPLIFADESGTMIASSEDEEQN